MYFDTEDSSHDENVDRRIPKSMRKTYDKRRGPIAARASNTAKPSHSSGLHRRHRRRYGL